MNKHLDNCMKQAKADSLVDKLFGEYNPTDPTKKNWRVTYEVLFNGDTEPTRRVVDFHYFETALELVKRTEKHTNMLFANIERI